MSYTSFFRVTLHDESGIWKKGQYDLMAYSQSEPFLHSLAKFWAGSPMGAFLPVFSAIILNTSRLGTWWRKILCRGIPDYDRKAPGNKTIIVCFL